jgi:hypothetical protein
VRIIMHSMKHSSKRTFRRPDGRTRGAGQRLNCAPPTAHSCKRRRTAFLKPYRAGSSLQGTPDRKIRRLTSKQLRSSGGGRPPFRKRSRSGDRCLKRSHCLSETARQAMGHTLDLVSHGTKVSCQMVRGAARTILSSKPPSKYHRDALVIYARGMRNRRNNSETLNVET